MLGEQGEDGRETGLVSIPKTILVELSIGNRAQEYKNRGSKPPPKVEQSFV